MERAAAYCRFSSDSQSDGNSIQAQTNAITEYCKKNSIELVKVYVDEARSATSDDRQQFQQLIKDAGLKIFDKVIVHKLDRFSRNRYDSAMYKKRLKECGIRLISVLETLDDSPESVILESVLEGMSEYYSKNLSREVKKGLKINAKEAKFNGGIPPLGYDVINGDYVINEREAEAIRIIFERFLEGVGYVSIAEELNQKKFLSKRGRELSKASVYDILKNPKYSGRYFYKVDGTTIESEIKIPAIIDEEVFLKINEIITTRKTILHTTDRKRKYLLSGLIICGECGGRYCGNSSGSGTVKEYIIYSCSTRENKGSSACSNPAIRREYIQNYVLNELTTKILTDEAIESISEKIIDIHKESATEFNTEKGRLEKAIREVAGKTNKYFQLFEEEDNLPAHMLKEKISSLESQRIMLEKQLAEVLLRSQKEEITVEKVTEYLKAYRSDIYSKDEKLIRRALEAFVDKIVITRGEIKVMFKIFDNLRVSDKDNSRLTIQESFERKEIYRGRPLYNI